VVAVVAPPVSKRRRRRDICNAANTPFSGTAIADVIGWRRGVMRVVNPRRNIRAAGSRPPSVDKERKPP
jgi:hypothetical protein